MVFFSAWSYLLLAQQDVSAPQSAKPPFSGTIGYRISYTGIPKGQLGLYPDSLTIHVQHPRIVATWHGGLSDTLGLTLFWDASGPTMWLQDNASGRVWEDDERAKSLDKITWRNLPAGQIAGYGCKVTERTEGKNKTVYHLADSLSFPFQLADSLKDSLSNRVPAFMAKGYPKLPLRIIHTTPIGTITTTVAKVTPVAINEELPSLPWPTEAPVPFDRLTRYHPLGATTRP